MTGAHAAPPPAGAAGAASDSLRDAGDASVGQLLSEISQDLSTLMRQEVQLARAEIKTEIAKAGKGAGMLGGAGFAGYLVVLFLSFAAWWGLANAIDTGLAALIVAGVWAVIGTVLYVLGRDRFRRVNPTPERAIDTAKQIPDALKTQ
ncbi:MAG TPA: phage holin family protein [Jatrophihabitans sp.]|nr:phage holin family protein [Jatrophihabitans sp.]